MESPDKFTNKITQGDCLDLMRQLPDGCVQTCVTSPPYWGLRDYDVEPLIWDGNPRCAHEFKDGLCLYCNAWRGALGLEPTPELYVDHMVLIFREVKRILRHDGTLWLNLGDTHFGSQCGKNEYKTQRSISITNPRVHDGPRPQNSHKHVYLKPKDECDIPFLVKLALKQDGWYARQTIIFAKRNSLPESVRDRPTKAHEYIFLMAKSKRYYCDMNSIRVPHKYDGRKDSVMHGSLKYQKGVTPTKQVQTFAAHGQERWPNPKGANARSVWFISLIPFKGAHFAVYPPELARRCILAGAPENGIVLDPFMGSGTTAAVALQNKRRFIGFELNPEYCELARERITEIKSQPEQFQFNFTEEKL